VKTACIGMLVRKKDETERTMKIGISKLNTHLLLTTVAVKRNISKDRPS